MKNEKVVIDLVYVVHDNQLIKTLEYPFSALRGLLSCNSNPMTATGRNVICGGIPKSNWCYFEKM